MKRKRKKPVTTGEHRRFLLDFRILTMVGDVIPDFRGMEASDQTELLQDIRGLLIAFVNNRGIMQPEEFYPPEEGDDEAEEA